MDKFYGWMGKGLLGTLSVGAFMLVLRIVGIALTWLSGKIVEWVFGGWIASGVNAIFPQAHFAAWMIPVACVILYLAGSCFFQQSSENKAK